MTNDEQEQRVVSASRVIDARPETIFELIADPSRQPEWDGNDNLAQAEGGQRVRGVGEMFAVRITTRDLIRENYVVEFEEGRRIAWNPASEGEEPSGHLWRWELEPVEGGTQVTHTYDWTELRDEARLPRARNTKAENLRASLDRLAKLAEKLERED